jgi:hypothetical protein
MFVPNHNRFVGYKYGSVFPVLPVPAAVKGEGGHVMCDSHLLLILFGYHTMLNGTPKPERRMGRSLKLILSSKISWPAMEIVDFGCPQLQRGVF